MSSRLDYCNSFLYGIADTNLIKLQRIHNRLLLVVRNSPPFTHRVLLLNSLHWLPVKFRIFFKVNLLITKKLHEKQPVYLHSMLVRMTLVPVTEIKERN